MSNITLNTIKSTPVSGNAHNDMQLMQDIDTFVHNDSNTHAERRESLVYMSEIIMGVSCADEAHLTDTEVVQQYIAEC